MSLDKLSQQLWKQRETLEMLLFKLEEERLLVNSGSTRWLPLATRELEAVIDKAKDYELERSMESENAAVELGLPPDASLREIAEAAEEPWKSLLTQHREALVTLTSETKDIVDSNQEHLKMLTRVTQETLMSLQENVSIYDGSGSTSDFGDKGGRMVDESI